MADYMAVKGGKLSFKGHKNKKSKKHKSHKRKHDGEVVTADAESLSKADTEKHGGWWEIKKHSQIPSNVAVEIMSNCYMTALDSGGIAVGSPRDEGDEPDPTEIFTVIKVLDSSKVAFKSGYGKYLSIEANGKVVGRSEAMGPREQFEPVFQGEEMAINGCNNCFLSCDEDGDIVCTSRTAGPGEMVKFRCNTSRDIDPLAGLPKEERGSVKDAEFNYIKKFQSYEDRRLERGGGVSTEEKSHLKKAKKEGDLHECMLDRREKMKADRYCK